MLLSEADGAKGGSTPLAVPILSIVIPVKNQWYLTQACIDSILTFPPSHSFEIIIVDDGSTDDTPDRLARLVMLDPRIRSARNPQPHCFARACNRGAGEAFGGLLLFMNNDIEAVHSGWCEPLVALLQQRSELGVVAPLLLFRNGTIQHCGKVWQLDAAGLLRTEHYLYEQPAELPEARHGGAFLTVTGACIMVRKEQFLRVGPFDDQYQNGWEDDDLCLAYREQGLFSWVCPESVLIHHQGATLKAEARVLERYLEVLQKKGIVLEANDPLVLSLKQRVGERAAYFEQAWQKNRRRFSDKWSRMLLPLLNETPQERTEAAIVLVTYNSAETIGICLESLVRTVRSGDRVIVVDNASRDATCGVVGRFKDRLPLELICNESNKGFSVASNQGVRLATTPFVVLLNPDTVVTTGWLERLTTCFKDRSVAAVGPVSNTVAGRQSVACYWEGNHPQAISPEQAAERLYRMQCGSYEETRLLIGFCVVLRRSVLQLLGGLDERLFLGNDDLELSWRLRMHGHRLLIACDTFIWHEGQHSFKTDPEATSRCLVQQSSDALYGILEAHYGSGRVPTAEELWGIDWFRPSRPAFNPAVRFSHILHLPKAWESPLSDGERPLVSIVILTFNQWDYTRESLDAVKRHTPEPYELIVVDNGSTDGTPERLQERAACDNRYRLLCNPVNRGYAGGCNQGIELARGDYIVLLNNDVVVTPEWLSGLLECHASHKKAGVVGPLTNRASGIQVVPEPDYDKAGGLDSFARQFRISHRFRRVWSRRIAGFCMLFHRSLPDEIGLLDEQFGTGNYEDDDICLRSAVAGYQNLVAADVFVHHHGSMSFKGNNIDYQSALMRNAALFQQKWSSPVHDPVVGRQVAACRAIEQVEQLLLDEQPVQAAELLHQSLAEHPDDLRLLQLHERAEQMLHAECTALGQIQQARAQGCYEYADALLVKAFVLEPWQSPLQNLLLELGRQGRPGLALYADEAFRLYPASRSLGRLRVELAGIESNPELLSWAEAFLSTFGTDERVLHVGMTQRHQIGPFRREAVPGKSVALCMIVKDEEQCLARCLASCKPVVHEIIIVDTGSTDTTRQIAELFGAKLIAFQWEGNFAAARNRSVEQATADWIFVMDADEVISQRDYKLFRQTIDCSLSGHAYTMTTRNYTLNSGYEGFVPCRGEYPESESGVGWTPSDKVRIFPNHHSIRFTGAIHEMVEDTVSREGITLVHHPVPVHHFGGVKRADNRAKQEQYLALGLKKLADRPDDNKAVYELAVQAAELEQFATAEQLWKLLLNRTPGFSVGWFNLGYVLLRLGRLQESSAASEKALELDPTYADALVNKAICEACLFRGKKAFEGAMQALQCCPENRSLLGLAALALYRMGRPDEGAELLRRLGEVGISCTQLIRGIKEAMELSGRTGDLAAVNQALAYSSAI